MDFGTNPIPENFEELQKQRKQEQYNSLIESFGDEEKFNQATNKLLAGVKDFNNFDLYSEEMAQRLSKLSADSEQQIKAQLVEKYGPEDSWQYGGVDEQLRSMMYQNAQAELQQQQSDLVKGRLYELYLPGQTPGGNEILDEMMTGLFEQSQASDIFSGQFARQQAEIHQEQAEITNAQRTGIDQFGDFMFTYGPSLMLLYGTGGQFTWQMEPSNTMDPDFGDDQSGVPTGWGEDYSPGEDMYYDPITGDIGFQDPNGGLPGYEDGEYVGPELPDYTLPDPVKEGIPSTGGSVVTDYPSFSSGVSTGSFGEYGYNKLQTEGETESKLGNFGEIKSFDQADDSPTGASVVSKWIDAMPNMPKAASFLYPQ